MTDLEIPWVFDLLHNPETRAGWGRQHPGRAAEMNQRFPLKLIIDHAEGRIPMDEITDKENEWQDQATAAAIAGARKIALGNTPLMNTPVGRLTDSQWGWIVTAAIFGWIRTRCQQAIAEGVDQEEAVRSTGPSPSPRDAAVVASILPTLADTACVDWALPLQAWSKDAMTGFLLLAWQLIQKAETTSDQGKIIGKSKDWDTKGDDISDVPFKP
jgi:hypothetical protein